jgi:hypothetical protein
MHESSILFPFQQSAHSPTFDPCPDVLITTLSNMFYRGIYGQLPFLFDLFTSLHCSLLISPSPRVAEAFCIEVLFINRL